MSDQPSSESQDNGKDQPSEAVPAEDLPAPMEPQNVKGDRPDKGDYLQESG